MNIQRLHRTLTKTISSGNNSDLESELSGKGLSNGRHVMAYSMGTAKVRGTLIARRSRQKIPVTSATFVGEIDTVKVKFAMSLCQDDAIPDELLNMRTPGMMVIKVANGSTMLCTKTRREVLSHLTLCRPLKITQNGHKKVLCIHCWV